MERTTRATYGPSGSFQLAAAAPSSTARRTTRTRSTRCLSWSLRCTRRPNPSTRCAPQYCRRDPYLEGDAEQRVHGRGHQLRRARIRPVTRERGVRPVVYSGERTGRVEAVGEAGADRGQQVVAGRSGRGAGRLTPAPQSLLRRLQQVVRPI